MAAPRAAFLGTPAAAVPTLKVLAGLCDVRAVFCNPDRPQGRGSAILPPPVKSAAIELGLGVFQPENWKDGRALYEAGIDLLAVPAARDSDDGRGGELRSPLGIDLAIVVAYGHILPAWMLDACPLGAWNLHFSLLPRWRGAAPVNHAIMAGDAQTGVSLMKMTPGLDAGPVLAQCRRPIAQNTYADSLLAELADDAALLLKEHIGSIIAGNAALLPQDDGLATKAPKLSRDMSRLDFTQSAPELHRRIRALRPWPGMEFLFGGTTVKILEVGPISHSDLNPGTLRWGPDGAWLTVGGQGAIELRTLQRPGKPPQPARQTLQPWGPVGAADLCPPR